MGEVGRERERESERRRERHYNMDTISLGYILFHFLIYSLTLVLGFLSLVVFLVWCFFYTQLTVLAIFEVKEKVQD